MSHRGKSKKRGGNPQKETVMERLVKEDSEDSDSYESNDKDNYYFCSYSETDIHHDMILDNVRTGTYRFAIEYNKHLFTNKTVLDIGCGTGILSVFSAKAGASKVIGVEHAKIVKFARETVKRNNYENVIEIIQGKMEDVELNDKVDIMVSEWMGYCLLLENMLQTVLDARDKWLDKNGIMLPDYAALYIVGFEEHHQNRYKLNWWYNVHGYNLSSVRKEALLEPVIKTVYPYQTLSPSYCFKEFDLYTVENSDLDFQSSFRLKFDRDGNLDAFVVYFSVDFTKCHTRPSINTSPEHSETHWKHTVFYLPNTVLVKTDEEVVGSISINRNSSNRRDLEVKIDYEIIGHDSNTRNTNFYFLH